MIYFIFVFNYAIVSFLRMIPNLSRLTFCPSFNASSIDSGNLSFLVSGNLKASAAAIIETVPKITIDIGGQNSFKFCIKIAITPAILAIDEHVPTAVFLISAIKIQFHFIS